MNKQLFAAQFRKPATYLLAQEKITSTPELIYANGGLADGGAFDDPSEYFSSAGSIDYAVTSADNPVSKAAIF